MKQNQYNFKISVIVPVYNVEKYIEKCVKSLLAQSLKELEIIFIDDRGTDNSVNIIKKYVSENSGIKILSNETNQGVAVSRNRGMKIAQGEFIAFLDADDWVEKDFYEKLYEKAIEENADIVRGGVVYENKGEQKTNKGVEHKIKQIAEAKRFIPLAYNWGFGLSIYKKELLEENHLEFPLLTNGEDIVFLVKALYYCKKFAYDFSAQYHYVQHQDSASHKYSQKYIVSVISHFAMIIEFLNQQQLCKKDYVAYMKNNILNPLHNYWKNFVEQLGTSEDIQYFLEQSNNIFRLLKYQKDMEISNYVNKKFYIFSIFPLYSIKKKNKVSRHYLFGIIPILKVKTK